MDKILKKIKSKKWELGLLVAIIATGVFLRVYHFSDWLHFEIDQMYDYDIVSPAVENGIANLPLLGPNVGGGTLRLGPAFYYMEYVSASIFGNTPEGHAANVLVLSILAMPLFYVFCKRYFSTYESLGLLAIFSTSLYNVLYSRFSWSPNVLPFLILFSFYALLRSVSPAEKHPARWFFTSVAAVTITSQIHFNSMFVVPLIAVTFIIIKRPRFDWKVWLSALAIIFVIYSPAILNDLKTNGRNYKDLIIKLNKTSSGSIFGIKTIIRTAEYDAYEYFFINTANDQINDIKLTDLGFACKNCSEDIYLKILAILLFLTASGVLTFNLFKEKDADRKNFLILITLWFLISFALFYTIARTYKMYPRFFLLVSPLAIIFYGFILQTIKSEKNKMRLAIFVLLIAFLAALNIQRINAVFLQLKNSPQTANDPIDTGDIFPNTNRVTLEEQQDVVDYIRSKYQENNYPVYIKAIADYAPSFWCLLEKSGIRYFDGFNEDKPYVQGNYFTINYSADSARNISNFQEKESEIFGKLRIQYMEPMQTTLLRQPESERTVRSDIKVMSKLLTWKKIFQK